MKTIRIKLFQFPELNERSQKIAIEYFRTNEDFIWLFNEAEDSLKKFCEIFDIKLIEFSFTETYRNKYSFKLDDHVLKLSGQRLARYIWNNYRIYIYKGKYYGKLVDTFKNGEKIPSSRTHPAGVRHVKRYSHCQIESSCVLTGVCYDDDLISPIYKFLKQPADKDFQTLLKDCLASLSKSVYREMDVRRKDDSIAGEIIANEYWFTSDGQVWNR